MLRALFALATAGRKDSAPHQPAVGQQARNAVLNIASGNTPLFMTTVSMDILHPKSVQHRKSVMQLVIFLIHKVRWFVHIDRCQVLMRRRNLWLSIAIFLG